MQKSDDQIRSEHLQSLETCARLLTELSRTLAPVVIAAVRQMQAVGRSIEQAANAVLARPGVQAGLRKLVSDLNLVHDRAQAIESPGHVPYFKSLGQGDLAARLDTGLVRYFAKRFYEEERDRRVALKAFHNLARRRRWHPALVVQVERLRDHCGKADFLDDAVRQLGDPDLKSEFLALVQRVGAGETTCGPQMLALAARIAPYAPSPRGRLPRFETILHQTFLQWSSLSGGRRAYTYGLRPGEDMVAEDFTDEATAATRIELRLPSFNPVAARRAGRKRDTRA